MLRWVAALTAVALVASACEPRVTDADAGVDSGTPAMDAGPPPCPGPCTSTEWRWDRVLSGSGGTVVVAIAGTPDGGVVVGGTFEGSVDLGGGTRTEESSVASFVVSLGPSGEHRWDRTFPALVTDVAVDADGRVLVVGSFWDAIDLGGGRRASAGETDAFVAAYSAAGAHAWDRVIGGAASDAGRSVAATAGAVVVAGRFEGTVDFGDGPRASAGDGDAFLLRLDSTGATDWVRLAGGAGDDGAVAVASNARGEIAWAGVVRGPVDLGGGTRGEPHDVAAFVATYDAGGAHAWDHRFVPLGPIRTRVEVRDVALHDSGASAIVGMMGNYADFGGGIRGPFGANAFVAVYAPSGAYAWDRVVVEGRSTGRSVAFAPNGDVVISGTSTYPVDLGSGWRPSLGRSDAFVVRYDAFGCYRYELLLGGPEADDAAGIVPFDDHMTLAGFFSGGVSFGGEWRPGSTRPSGFVLTFGERDACCAGEGVRCASRGDCCMGLVCSLSVCRVASERNFE